MQLARRLTLLLAALCVGLASGPAAAHSDDGALRIVSETPAGPLAVTYEVELIFANDGDPANGATVTATAVGADGAALGPHTFQPTGDPGRYTATITFPAPGPWQLSITATDPDATLDAATTISAAPTVPATTVAPPTLQPTTAPPPAVPPSTAAATVAPTVPTPAPTTAPASTPAVSGDASGGNTGVVLAVLAGLLVAAAGGAVVARRNKRQA